MMKIAWFIAVLTAGSAVFGQPITVQPLNTAARLGTKAFFNSTANLGEGEWLAWYYMEPYHPPGREIYTSLHGKFTEDNKFGIELDASRGMYNVIVKQVEPELVGRYWCKVLPGAEMSKYARLIAVHEMRCPGRGRYVLLGEKISLTCSVDFEGYRNPSLTWTNPYGSQLPARTIIQSSKVTTIAHLTASAIYDDLRLTCSLEFVNTNSTSNPKYSSNAPIYLDECATFFYVIHPVTKITFDPPAPEGILPHALLPGQTIKCNANGRPIPRYVWQDPKGKTTTGQRFIITDEMTSWRQPINCTCSASNVVDGEKHVVKRTVQFRVGHE